METADVTRSTTNYFRPGFFCNDLMPCGFEPCDLPEPDLPEPEEEPDLELCLAVETCLTIDLEGWLTLDATFCTGLLSTDFEVDCFAESVLPAAGLLPPDLLALGLAEIGLALTVLTSAALAAAGLAAIALASTGFGLLLLGLAAADLASA